MTTAHMKALATWDDLAGAETSPICSPGPGWCRRKSEVVRAWRGLASQPVTQRRVTARQPALTARTITPVATIVCRATRD